MHEWIGVDSVEWCCAPQIPIGKPRRLKLLAGSLLFNSESLSGPPQSSRPPPSSFTISKFIAPFLFCYCNNYLGAQGIFVGS